MNSAATSGAKKLTIETMSRPHRLLSDWRISVLVLIALWFVIYMVALSTPALLARIREFEEKLASHLHNEFPEVRGAIESTGELTDAVAAKLKEIIVNFKKTFLAAVKR